MCALLQVSSGSWDNVAADVVFVHGLQGDPRGTWTNRNGGFWPSWLAEDNADLAVWSVGYEAPASGWTGTAMPLFDRANHILADLKDSGLGDRPICWLAHSMGGLLVKKMLRNAGDIAREFGAIRAASRCVVFIGTPNTGSNLASRARRVRLLRPSVATIELSALSPALLELNTWYRENHSLLGVATMVFFENQPTKGLGIVVDRGTADPGLEGVIPIGLDADHQGMCKPLSRDDPIYKRTLNFVRSTLTTAIPPPVRADDLPVSRKRPDDNTKPLPEPFARRDELLAEAKAELLKPARIQTARMVGLVGMGGVGKSVLARALARDEQVRNAFHDGTHWLYLGQKPDTAARLKDLAAAFGDYRDADDSQQRLERLNRLLRGASCLVILDDVWNRADLRDFQLSEPKSALLITARGEDVLYRSTPFCKVRTLLAGPARDLLAASAGQDPTSPPLPDAAGYVADKCDGLPLALAVAGGMVADGYSWDDLRDLLERARTRELEIREREYNYNNLFQVLDASVSCLTMAEREAYLSLAVFDGLGEMPVDVACLLWREAGFDESESRRLMIRLSKRSLLQHYGSTRAFTLHSLQFMHAREELGEQRLRMLHSSLASKILDRWEGWNQDLSALRTSLLTEPADRYGVLNLTAHLKAAGRDDDVHRLLAVESSAAAVIGRPSRVENTWYAAHERIGETAAYSADVRLAGNLAKSSADRAFAAAEPTAGIGPEIRYALVSASISSIAAGIPRPLIVALVADGRWTARQGLKQAQLLPTAEEKARTLVDLLGHLNEARRADAAAEPPSWVAEIAAEALAAAEAIGEPSLRASILTALAVQTDEPDRATVVARAFEAVRAIEWESSRARALAALAWKIKLPRALRDEALKLARASGDPGSLAAGLTALAPQLRPSDRLAAVDDAWTAIGAISQPEARTAALVTLMPRLPTDDRAAAASHARRAAADIRSSVTRARALIALAARLSRSDPMRDAVLNDAQETIGAISQPEAKAAALIALLPRLSDRTAAETDALAAVDVIGDREARAAALTALIPKLPGRRRLELIAQALDVIGLIRQPKAKADALIALIPLDKRAGQLQEKAAAAIDDIGQSAARAAALTALASHQEPGPRRSATLAQALAEACTIDDSGPRATGITALASYLPGWDNPEAALDGRRAIDRALAEARACTRPKPRAIALAILGSALPEEEADHPAVLHEAVLEAHDVMEPADRAAVFTLLIPLIRRRAGPARGAAILQACAACDISDPDLRRAALSALVSAAPDALEHQAESVATAVNTVLERAGDLDTALAACGADVEDRPTIPAAILTTPARALFAGEPGLLPPRTPMSQRVAVFRSAQDVTFAVDEMHSRATALATMTAGHFAGSNDPGRESAAAGAIARTWSMARALSAQSDRLPEALADRLLAAAQAIDDAHSRATRNPPQAALPPPRNPGPAAGAGSRARVPGATAGYPRGDCLPPWDPYWRAVIEEAALGGRTALISDLSALGAVIVHFGGTAAIQDIIEALLDVGRWWP
jgi:NB-ARC domain